MSDLAIGLVIIGVLSALLLLATLRISRSLPRRTANLLAIMTVALMLANSLLFHDSVILTHLLPFSNLVVIGNWAPLFVAALTGLIWWRVPGGIRRVAVVSALGFVCLLAMYVPILSTAPQMNDRWDHGVCLQTSQASCSPAAAATLLNAYGIKTTEQEMALLCLTSTKGTSMHGLWRGLKLKTANSGYDVYMFNHASVEDLKGMGPVLLSVELMPRAKVDPRYQASWGWMPGVPHTVVVMDFAAPGSASVADPATGKEAWSIDDLGVLWHGVAVRLIKAKS
ncbi:MAG TPA: cysteine peptidase family C39 domain-containing protein [Tepidisphaeraceae bacterium]|jgi:predicted double-glycine peptidase